jgi:hypothetical protein
VALTTKGKGAFRRFKDQLHEEHPGLLPAWYAFRDARLRGKRFVQDFTNRFRGNATHLATAVVMGADRFITNNQRDFRPRSPRYR